MSNNVLKIELKIAITFLRNIYISRYYLYIMQFVRPKTSDKLSVNIDHVCILYIYSLKSTNLIKEVIKYITHKIIITSFLN